MGFYTLAVQNAKGVVVGNIYRSKITEKGMERTVYKLRDLEGKVLETETDIEHMLKLTGFNLSKLEKTAEKVLNSELVEKRKQKTEIDY